MSKDGRAERLTDGDIIELIQLIDKRADDGQVDAQIPQLLQGHVVLDDGDDVPPDAVYVCVDGQVGVGVNGAREDRLRVDLVADMSSQQRPALWFQEVKVSARGGAAALRLTWAGVLIRSRTAILLGLVWHVVHVYLFPIANARPVIAPAPVTLTLPRLALAVLLGLTTLVR